MKLKAELFDLLKNNSYKQLDLQSSAIESIETKTTSILTILLAIPTVLVTALTISEIRPEWNMLLTIGSVFLALSFFFSIKSLICRRFSIPAEIEDFLAENRKQRIDKVRINFLDDCRKSINKNVRRLESKSRDFNLATIFLVVATVLIIGGIIKGRWFAMTDKDNQKPPSVTITNDRSGAATPSEGGEPQSPDSESSNSGLPDDRQGTTLDIFKGKEDKTIKEKK